jgi:hypothetical protein
MPDVGLYRVTADDALDQLAEDLRAEDFLEAAYVEPAATTPQLVPEEAPRSSTGCCPIRPTPARNRRRHRSTEQPGPRLG